MDVVATRHRLSNQISKLTRPSQEVSVACDNRTGETRLIERVADRRRPFLVDSETLRGLTDGQSALACRLLICLHRVSTQRPADHEYVRPGIRSVLAASRYGDDDNRRATGTTRRRQACPGRRVGTTRAPGDRSAERRVTNPLIVLRAGRLAARTSGFTFRNPLARQPSRRVFFRL